MKDWICVDRGHENERAIFITAAFIAAVYFVVRITRPLWADYYPMKCDAGRNG